tara:strand:+ start:100 stop:450 length:351 start_codon:yes stop_codon:yes gene_type:complete
MGKPYDHNYFFAGDMSSKGSMLCCHCNQPIFNHSQDWMSYKKSKSGDWAFYCFHRKCTRDQSGWEKIEKDCLKKEEQLRVAKEKFKGLAKDLGLMFDIELVEAAADAVGVDLADFY